MAHGNKAAGWLAGLGLALAGQAAPLPPPAAAPPVPPYESAAAPRPANRIDELVFRQLAQRGLRPVLCSDAVFVRRAYLDVIGTLPTAEEARTFLEEPDTAHKRQRLIERLLERSEFADYWALRWGDLLRIKAEFPVNLWPNAAQLYHRWVRAALAENKSYDRFARELLTASGSNFRDGPVNFYRAVQNRTPDGLAAAVALAFLGTRTEAWPKERAAGLAACFAQVGYKPTSEWKEEIVFWDPQGSSAVPAHSAPGRAALVDLPGTNTHPAAAVTLPSRQPPSSTVLPDGTRLKLPPDQDPRELFANWLITPKNPWFARAIVNRIWYWLMGRGIIHEPDDIRPDNPPANAALLAYLERELVAGQYDLKHIYRLILNSQTYQLSSLPAGPAPAADVQYARYVPRRLDAEVLIDAINQVTGATDLYTSPIPAPFTYLPAGEPALRLPDGSITSPFLALFGRSARASGLASERDNKPIPAQALHLLNSSHIQKKIEQGPRLKELWASRRPLAERVDELYLTLLSRPPTAAERQVLTEAGLLGAGQPAKSQQARRRELWLDLTWALINSTEFIYRH